MLAKIKYRTVAVPALAAFLAFHLPITVPDAIGAELKKPELRIEKPTKKLDLGKPEAKKLEVKTKPKKLKVNKNKLQKVAPKNKSKKPNARIAKPGTQGLKKLATQPRVDKLDGEPPTSIKGVAVQQPRNLNKALKKDLLEPSSKSLVKDLKPVKKLPDTAPDADPVNAAQPAAGIGDTTSAAGLQVDPDSNLSKKDLVAPDMKDLVVKPQISGEIRTTLSDGSERNSALEGVVGEQGSGVAERGDVAKLGEDNRFETSLGESFKQLESPDPAQERARVLDGKFQVCVSSSGKCGTYTKAELLDRLQSKEDPNDISDSEVADMVVSALGVGHEVTVYEDGYSESGNNEANGEGGESAPLPEFVDLGGDGEWKTGFAGLGYYEYDEDDTQESSGESGGSESAGGSGDEFQWAWEDDQDTSNESGDSNGDTSDDNQNGDNADAGTDDDGADQSADAEGNDQESDTASEDCPEGSEGCGETGNDEGEGESRTVDGGQESPSDCATPGACDEDEIAAAAEEESGGNGTLRTAEDEGKGGPLNKSPDTSGADGTLRLANEEPVGGELVRGETVLQGGADGTLRVPEGESDDDTGTPQIAGDAGGSPGGSPGVVTENTGSAGQLEIKNVELDSGNLKLDQRALDGISEQVNQ